MLHRLLGVFSLASLLVAQTPCGAPAIAQTVPSASPLAAPSASAAPPYRDPDLHPATAASRAWILQLRRTAYVAASGHRLLFGSALAPLMRFSASQPIGDYEPGIVRDRRRGLLKICFVFAPCRSDSSMYAVVRAADVPAPPASIAGTIDEPSIGMTVAALLASFRRDANFVGKNIVKDATGAVYLIAATDQDPPPGKYDHGLQATFENEYVVRDGVVVARIALFSEN